VAKQVSMQPLWWTEHMQDVAEDYKNMMIE
jgi:hypothetical protein